MYNLATVFFYFFINTRVFSRYKKNENEFTIPNHDIPNIPVIVEEQSVPVPVDLNETFRLIDEIIRDTISEEQVSQPLNSLEVLIGARLRNEEPHIISELTDDDFITDEDDDNNGEL